MIKILSRKLFWDFLKKEGIDDTNVSSIKNTFFVSINSTSGNDSDPFFKEKHFNVLTLFFDDCDGYQRLVDLTSRGGFYEQIPMGEEEALEVLDFVKKIDKTSNVFVHCTAGVSRSGAIGAFINDYLGNSWGEFKMNNPMVIPNSHISSLLKKVYYEL
jgi:predicted protein tyrosine phosphatase